MDHVTGQGLLIAVTREPRDVLGLPKPGGPLKLDLGPILLTNINTDGNVRFMFAPMSKFIDRGGSADAGSKKMDRSILNCSLGRLGSDCIRCYGTYSCGLRWVATVDVLAGWVSCLRLHGDPGFQ
jgi:hypothetical protein